MTLNLKERAKQLKIDIPAVYLALKSKETPIGAKILAAVTVAYALSPIDLIPDFVPILGYLDDLILLPLLIALTVKFIPREQMERFRADSAEMWQNGKPKRWFYAVPIVVFWLLIAFIIVKALFFR